jgi:RNA polymerase sigma-70 factor, ECF subfamily
LFRLIRWLKGGKRLDSTYTLGYTGWAVSATDSRNPGRDNFATEILIYLDHLYRVAFHLVRNADEAKDCVQETCTRALSAQGQFLPGSNMKAWLTRILYNFFYDSYARNKRTIGADDLRDGTDSADFWEAHAGDGPGPEVQVLDHELGAQVGNALKQIPEEFRAPILLVDMGDFTYAEAAEILSCPIGTVRSRLSRGRRLLQKHLSDYLEKSGID